MGIFVDLLEELRHLFGPEDKPAPGPKELKPTLHTWRPDTVEIFVIESDREFAGATMDVSGLWVAKCLRCPEDPIEDAKRRAQAEALAKSIGSVVQVLSIDRAAALYQGLPLPRKPRKPGARQWKRALDSPSRRKTPRR
jgi:hypothetical protein